MPFAAYYARSNSPIRYDSRSKAAFFKGLQCPVDLEVNYTHGTTPGAGGFTLEGSSYDVRAGAEVQIQIGGNTYYGVIVKREKAVRQQTGYQVKFLLADTRDRLDDDNVFAQFNMISQDGEVYHTLPNDWNDQRLTIMRATKLDWQNRFRDAGVVRRVAVGGCTRLLSAAEILDWLASYLNFTWSATPVALSYLETGKPPNLDWNNGTKGSQAIQEVLEFSGAQFTTYGNLHLHITQPGVPENGIQWDVLTDDAKLCAVGSGYSQASLGQELNTKGRRVILLGARNRYQFVHPMLPGWNTNWNWYFTFDLVELQLVMRKAGLTGQNKLRDMPPEYHDFGTWQGKSRMDMTIYDYKNQIPFRVYVADMSSVLDQDGDVSLEDAQGFFNQMEFKPNGNIKFLPFELRKPYRWDAVFPPNDVRANHVNPQLFSRFPISDHLITHSGDLQFNQDAEVTLTSRQFFVWANSRTVIAKNAKNPWEMINHTIRIDDGAALQVEDILHSGLCNRLYKVEVVFSLPRYLVLASGGSVKDETSPSDNNFGRTPTPGSPSSYKDEMPYTIIPDRPFLSIATDREIYRREFGEPSRRGATVRYRQRERIVSAGNLRRGFVQNEQVYMMMANLNVVFNDLGQLVKDQNGNLLQAFSTFTADQIAPSIAAQALRHEMITSAGTVTFEDATGFKPDGLINSVVDRWTPSAGMQETVNFTNDETHEFRTPVLELKTVGAGNIIPKQLKENEERLRINELRRRAFEEVKQPVPIRHDRLPNEATSDNYNFSPAARLQEFGSKNTVVASLEYDQGNENRPSYKTAELLILES